MATSRVPTFQTRFRELRGAMTQSEFAEKLGISRPTVGLYESGARIPDAEVLGIIARKCGVSADYLLGLTDIPSNDPDMKMIGDYTGLNQKTLERINWYTTTHEDNVFNRKALNSILGNAEMYGLLKALLSAVEANRLWNSSGRAVTTSGTKYELPNEDRSKVILPVGVAVGYFKHYAEEEFQCIVDDVISECEINADT